MTAPTDTDLLGRILTAQTFAFALVSRPESGVPGMLDVLVGDVSEVETLSDIPLAADAEGWDVLAVVPYRQLAERGFDAPDDGAPLLVMTVGSQDQVPVAAALARLPDSPTVPVGGHFDLDDDAQDLVQRIVDDEIGKGEGANFVLADPSWQTSAIGRRRPGFLSFGGCCSANSGPTGPSSSMTGRGR